jgi:arylsulfatase A-like enzyme
MLRSDRYKYVRYSNDPTVQLFDMDNDPWETKNLAEDPSKKSLVDEYEKRLQDYEKTLKFAKAK